MSKLKGPLMSLDARGKLADTLVFSGWKGLKVARMYAVPANPKTAAQQQQRSYMANAVDAWRTLSAKSTDNWNHYNQYLSKAQSGFNAFVSNLLEGQANLAAALYSTSLSHDSATLSVKTFVSEADTQTAVASDQSLELNYGTSPNVLSNVATFTYVADDEHETDVLNLSVGVTYFARVFNPSENRMISGLLKFST